jgi:hypothetical protein
MANSEHMDLLSSTSESISNMKSKLKNIEMILDIDYPNNLKDVLREIIWRRYKIYKNQLNLLSPSHIL